MSANNHVQMRFPLLPLLFPTMSSTVGSTVEVARGPIACNLRHLTALSITTSQTDPRCLRDGRQQLHVVPSALIP